MQEDFLHHIWKYQKFYFLNLNTVDGESLSIIKVGLHNQNSGPDFFNSQVKIDGQLWAGNVEIHIKSSDWYAHNHERDPNYDNVILHVVWEHDTDIYRKDNTTIPTLILNDKVEKDVLHKYRELMSNKEQFINCQKDFHTIDEFYFRHWVDRLYIERLERKSRYIHELLKQSNNDWEAVLFKMLSRYFGLKVNGDSFFSMAQSIDFSIIRKIRNDQSKLEALFFGQLGMLPEDESHSYISSIKSDYNFLSNKFKLGESHAIPVKYFRLRPTNFPTIRLSQLASLYKKNSNLFSLLINANSQSEVYSVFDIYPSTYWQNHYTFTKSSKFSYKKVTKSFVDLIIINVIVPLKFCNYKEKGMTESQNLLSFAEAIPSEKNSVVDRFKALREIPNSSLFSQALIQLKSVYCDKNKCLNCEIGNILLNG